MRYEGILFDVGGTLLCGEPSDVAILARHFLGRAQHDGEAEMAGVLHRAQATQLRWILPGQVARDRTWTNSCLASFHEFVARELSCITQSQVSKQAINDCLERCSNDRRWRIVDPDVPRLLARMKLVGQRMGIVSNWEAGLQEILEGAGIRSYFDVVISSYDVGIEKPDPEIYFLACRQMEVAPERCLYVGDMALDIVGAQSAGMDAALVGTLSVGILEEFGIEPTITIGKASQIMALLQRE